MLFVVILYHSSLLKEVSIIRNTLTKAFLSLLLFLIFLVGCSDKRYTLKGESESWKANYNVIISGEIITGVYTLYYQNKDWKDIGKYTVTVGDKEIILKEEGVLNRTITINDSNISPSEAQESTKILTIEWDDKKEEIILSKK